MIHKYNPTLRYLADDVSFPGQRIGNINGIMINYGNTKSKEERAETLKRRRKAWANGEPKGHGTHYLEGERKNWIWEKEKLNDVRKSKYYPFVEKLQEVIRVESEWDAVVDAEVQADKARVKVCADGR